MDGSAECNETTGKEAPATARILIPLREKKLDRVTANNNR